MKRTFIHFNEAWYAEAEANLHHDWADQIDIQVEDGDVVRSVTIEWYPSLRNRARDATKFSCFDDEWGIFPLIADVLDFLAVHDGKNITPDQLVQGLLDRGFEDETEKTNPKGEVA